MIDLFTVIVNPISGQGAALTLLPEVENVLTERALAYRVLCSPSPEAATQYAQTACAEGAEGVIAMGGDGTLFQIANGMLESNVPLIFVSCGTGNDFVRSLKLPPNPIEALKLQLEAPICRIDMGKMNELCFLNVSGTGFDVDVLRYVEQYKQRYRGFRAYMRALYDAIRNYHPTTAMVSFDGGEEEHLSFAILSIGNGRYIGGGMKAVPEAEVNDGLFDVVVVKPVAKGLILPLIALYIAGKHVSIGLANLRRCRTLTLKCDGMTVNLDGELRKTDVARFELLPNALTVRIPEKNNQ